MDESFLKKCSIITLSRDVYAWSYARQVDTKLVGRKLGSTLFPFL